jgi:hypothetical protein
MSLKAKCLNRFAIFDFNMISKTMFKRTTMWRLPEKSLRFVVVVLLFTISPSFNQNLKDHEALACANAQELEKVVPFVFTSQIGGMVAGFSAMSNSTYISLSGLVQVSKEETNGILHTFLVAHTDTSKLFQDIGGKMDFTQMRKPVADNKNDVLSEYYPPKRFFAYFLKREDGFFYEYFEETNCPDSCKKFVEKISDFSAKTTLHYAKPGLYVRAQRVNTSNLQLISFDLELERSDLLSFPTLNKILQNEMALVQVHKKQDRAILDGNIMVKAGDPVHARIGKDVYLIFPYRYDPHY